MNSDYTRMERKIRNKLREITKEKRIKGHVIKVTYKKLIQDDKILGWKESEDAAQGKEEVIAPQKKPDKRRKPPQHNENNKVRKGQ